jgi:hypothetical protein
MQFAAIRCLRRIIPMLRFVRAGLAAAALGLAMTAVIAADKPFKQVALEEAAIKLEAQIKGDAGVVSRAAAALRRDADAAFQKNDFRTGMLVLGQVLTVAPDDAGTWLPLSRTILQIKPRDDRDKGAAARSWLDRRLYRLPSSRRSQYGSRQPGRPRPDPGRSPRGGLLGLLSRPICQPRL